MGDVISITTAARESRRRFQQIPWPHIDREAWADSLARRFYIKPERRESFKAWLLSWESV